MKFTKCKGLKDNMYTHLSLFSGIGGMDMAAEAAGFVTVGQVEFADYPTKVLEKNFPDVERWRDVREFTAVSFRERTGYSTVDVLSGGFPCQPHSLAGKRLASADDRDLWGEMRRIICELRPEWVVAENVRGLLSSENGRFFAGILRDFSDLGYDVGWCMLSAAAVGALHRRERVAIVAHTCGNGLQRRCQEKRLKKAVEQSERIYLYLLQRADKEYLSESAIFRKDDGISYRVDRTKALGNAVVPQSFYLVFKAIYELLETDS